jgi:hypothetical protein
MRSFIICTHPQISYADQIEENEVGGACGTHGRGEKSVKGFYGRKPEGKRPLGRPRCIWEDGIRMDLKEIGWRSGFSWLRIWISSGLL